MHRISTYVIYGIIAAFLNGFWFWLALPLIGVHFSFTAIVGLCYAAYGVIGSSIVAGLGGHAVMSKAIETETE